MSESDEPGNGNGSFENAPESNSVARKKRVLLVEDDVSARFILLNQLNKAGVDVELASNGPLALKKLSEVLVDAVILDLILPGAKGVDLIKDIRRKKGFSDVPIFVCTPAARMKAWGRSGSKGGPTRAYDKAATPVEAIVAEIVADLNPGTRTAQAQPQPAAPNLHTQMFVLDAASPDTSIQPAASVPPEVSPDAAPAEPPSLIFPLPPAASAPPQAPILLDEPLAPWKTPKTLLRLPTTPREVAALALELHQKLENVTCERDALVSLLSNKPIVQEAASEQPKMLERAEAAAMRAEAAYQVEAARSKQFEQELAHLQQVRDELNERLAREDAQRAESKSRSEELERRLSESAGEIERLKTQLDQHVTARTSLEAELGRQLETAKAAAARAEAACREESARSQKSSAELENLRRARDELNTRLGTEHQAAEESRRRSEERERQLKEKAAELERLTVQLEQQKAQRGSVESALSKQLKAAKEAAEKAQAACQEEAMRGTGLEQEAARLAAARDDLNRKLAEQEQAAAQSRSRSDELEQRLAQSTAELTHAKSELERHASERTSVETQLREQLESARATAEQVQRQYGEETSFFNRSKDELAALRSVRDELNTRLAQEREAAEESRTHSEELENRLRQRGGELDQLRAELEKQIAARAALEGQLSQQLENSREAAAKAAAAYKQEATRRRRFEDELTKLRKTKPAPGGKSKSPATSARRIQELEAKAQQSTAELERVKAELDKQMAERTRLESEYQSFSKSSDSLDQQLSKLCEGGGAIEGRVRDSISALARVTADLEKTRGDRRRLEERVGFLSTQLQNLHEELRRHLEVEKSSQEHVAQLEQQLREREDALRRAAADLEKESAERQLAEAQLRASGEVSTQLKEQFGLLDEAKTVFKRTQDELEGRLKSAAKELDAAKTKLQKHTAERQKLQAAAVEAQRQLQEHTRKSGLELRKLQSALEVESLERRRLEGQAVHSRYSSLEAARLGRAFVNSFRSQLRAPAETLMQTIRQLLEASLEDESKKLVEKVLESALLLQTNLQDEALVAQATRPDAADSAGAPKAA